VYNYDIKSFEQTTVLTSAPKVSKSMYLFICSTICICSRSNSWYNYWYSAKTVNSYSV